MSDPKEKSNPIMGLIGLFFMIAGCFVIVVFVGIFVGFTCGLVQDAFMAGWDQQKEWFGG